MLIYVHNGEIKFIEEEIEKTNTLISEAAEILGEQLEEVLKDTPELSALSQWKPVSCVEDYIVKLSGQETTPAVSLYFLLTTDLVRQGYTDEDG